MPAAAARTQRGLDAMLAAWPSTESEAMAVQQGLRERVVREDAWLRPVRRVAGVDVAYARDGASVHAAAVVLDAHRLAPIEACSARRPVDFPYVPGLFAFRELPALLQALAGLHGPIDLVVCDGHGIAHPRRLGLAAHLGVLLDLPCIGVAKTRLIGVHDEPAAPRGSRADLVDGSEVVGAVLRTQNAVKPVYVSIGHRVCLDTAVEWTLRLAPRHRLPETTRQSDRLVNALRREVGGTRAH